MKMFKLSVLGVAILATTSITATANIINDSTLDIKLRNVFYNKDIPNDEGWKQWAQGAEINFKSGYFADLIGFNASYYGALKLHNSGADTPNELLGGSDGNKGYSKLGQAHLKTKLGDENIGFYGQAGLLTINRGLITSCLSKATPDSFRGFHGQAHIYDFTIYGSYVDQISQQTKSNYKELTNYADRKIDNTFQLGGAYSAYDISAELTYLQSKNYQNQYLLDLGYTLPLENDMELFISGVYHQSNKGGYLWNNDSGTTNTRQEEDRGFDNKAMHYNLNAKLSIGELDLTFSYGETNAKKLDGLGQIEYWCQENGEIPSLVSRQISDFMYNNESVWQIETSYKLDKLGAPGLKASLAYTDGSKIKDYTLNKKLNRENEIDLVISYKFQQESLNGLCIKLEHGWHTSMYKDSGNERSKDLRCTADYTVSVF